MAQNVSLEAKATLSSDDDQKLEQASQMLKAGIKLYDTDNYIEAEPLFAETLRVTREVLGDNHTLTLASLNGYADVLQNLGRTSEAEPLFAEALRLRREVLGERHPDTLESLSDYASVLQDLGRASEAEPLYAEALKLSQDEFGEEHAFTRLCLNQYASVLHELGRDKQAEPLYAEALRLSRKVLGDKHFDTLAGLSGHAMVLNSLGRTSEAEPLLSEALRLRRKLFGEKHPDTIRGLNNYASVLQDLGRASEAEPLSAEALRFRREVLGEKHPDTINSLNNYASALQNLGRASEAEPLFAKALRHMRELFGEKHPDTINSLNNYASALKDLGRASEAEPLFAEALHLRREVLGEKHPDTLVSLSNYASVLWDLGRPIEAEPFDAEALRLRREVLGDKYPGTLLSLNNLSYVRMDIPSRSHLAVEPARSLMINIRAARKVAGFTPSEVAQLGREEKNQSSFFTLFANAAWSRGPGLVEEAIAAGADPLDATAQAGLREEVFMALQDALAGAASKAITATVARKAAGPLEPLVMEREELSQQWIETENALIKTLGESDSASDEKRSNLRDWLATLKARLETIDDRLRNEAPEYFALIRPEALALSDAQKVLASDEAALMVVPTPYGTHIMLVSDEGLRWVRSDWGSDKIDAFVKRLLWDVGANVDVNAAEWVAWSEEGRGAYPFSFETSYALYRELIEPIYEGLKSKKHVFLSASGSLSSLPFGLLVSKVPEGDSGDPNVLRSAKWFADAHALIVIPSLQSLELLRKYRASDGRTPNTPFLGIGDPVLTGQSEIRGNQRSKRGVINGSGSFKRVFSSSSTRGGASVANISELRKMARLPGTATELTAMWEEFGKPQNALYLAEKATEDFVRTQNLNANIIAFATHGLLAGEISGTAEPGIVLTPPLRASERNDGYLSASEISALKLNADWVILSACNTAAGDGSEGAPGLSGLARSFFYAGARNLLASHWPVRDDVAAKLTVRTISIVKDNPQLTRAQAFQQAMREIRNDRSADSNTDTWAHPSAWAPFSLIGDGAN
ncbi:tetratricopeptide repeat protein [Parasphingorhabdus sp. JC815]|uniref:CHAT domain-containing protein n=1 Tax=Parasphingorhabdus sp. JC815 TaxID=3232140 RepID=UPI00345A0674